MTQDIVSTLRQLQLDDVLCGENSIDPVLDERRPRKRARKSEDDLKKDLEDEFLKPPTVFGPNWFNKLQQYVDHEIRRRSSS